jgi:hypothetical protein
MGKMITLQEDMQKDIEEIIEGLTCPKDFICYKSEFKKLCRVKDIGMESFLICSKNNLLECRFSIYFGDLYFCQCPLRFYIAKNLKK